MLANLMLLLLLAQAPSAEPAAADPAPDGAAAAATESAATEGAAAAPLIAPVSHVAPEGMERSWLFPPQASTFADDIDNSYYFTHYVCVFFTLLIVVWLVWFIVKFRRSKHPKPEVTSTHNTALELLWSVPPMFILGIIFWYGITDYLNLRTPPADVIEIKVTGRQWSWEFTYPNGASDSELHIPVDRPVRLTMRSDDVLHSFFVPAFRTKMDVVPGRYTELWFEANRTGQFAVFCTEYCGTKHSAMLANLFVEEYDEWEAYLAKAAVYWEGKTPLEVGQLAYIKKGCNACHSQDGAAGTGPTFKGIWGKTESFTDGSSATVDANYVRESILNPGAKIVAGFSNAMPPFQGRIKDPEIDGLIALIQSLKD